MKLTIPTFLSRPSLSLTLATIHNVDSNSPTFDNNLSGLVNMKDAIHQRISYTAPNGKQYNIRKDGKIATLIVRYVIFPLFFFIVCN